MTIHDTIYEPLGQRSIPGQGQTVHILCGCPDAEGKGYPDWDVLWGTTGEDFAVSNWPMVVKFEASLSRRQMIDHLRWMATRLERGGAHGQ